MVKLFSFHPGTSRYRRRVRLPKKSHRNQWIPDQKCTEIPVFRQPHKVQRGKDWRARNQHPIRSCKMQIRRVGKSTHQFQDQTQNTYDILQRLCKKPHDLRLSNLESQRQA